MAHRFWEASGKLKPKGFNNQRALKKANYDEDEDEDIDYNPHENGTMAH